MHALCITSLCKYSISSAFGQSVAVGIVSNLLDILASATDTGMWTIMPGSITSSQAACIETDGFCKMVSRKCEIKIIFNVY